jgi:hypothetical protein
MWTGKRTLTFFLMKRANFGANLLVTPGTKIIATMVKEARTRNKSHSPMRTLKPAPSGE